MMNCRNGLNGLRLPAGRNLRVVAILGLSVMWATSCGSSDSSSDDAEVTQPTAAVVDDSVPSSDGSSDDGTSGGEDESAGGSGPDGTYVVGDTYSDADFSFAYEGLVKVPLDDLGSYTDGECYFAIGSVTFLDGPVSQVSDSDTFSPSFDPILDGTLDSDQDDEFFNCSASAIGELGFEQSSTTNVSIGETASVWLDAIYVAPDQAGKLDGFRLYGDDNLVFSGEVTQDVSE